MDVIIRCDCANVDWHLVHAILKRVGMAHYSPDVHQKAFEASHTTVFAWHGDQLIGFGRAISDGVYQAAVYDVAVAPEYQGKGLGKTLMHTILGNLTNCNVILYASPGKEHFYGQFGFRNMKTGMALFKQAEAMRHKGFTE